MVPIALALLAVVTSPAFLLGAAVVGAVIVTSPWVQDHARIAAGQVPSSAKAISIATVQIPRMARRKPRKAPAAGAATGSAREHNGNAHPSTENKHEK